MSFYTKWLKLAKTSSPNYLRKMWMNISIAQLYVVQNVPYVHEYFLDINTALASHDRTTQNTQRDVAVAR